MKSSRNFTTVRRLVHDHLKIADKGHTGPTGDNVGPTPEASYAAAFATARGAFAVGAISSANWQTLNEEVSSHQSIARSN